MDYLELADWRRAVADLYSEVRSLAMRDARAAHDHWCEKRALLYCRHPQSPIPVERRSGFRATCFPYTPDLRFEVAVVPITAESQMADAGVVTREAPAGNTAATDAAIPTSTGEDMPMQRLGTVHVPFSAGTRRLTVYWMSGYAGGLYLPFRDATNGVETYAAGRYLLDAAKSADLGGDVERRTLILDFNFAYHPSCAFDARWACPLTPVENRLDIAIRAGERMPATVHRSGSA